MHRGNSKKYKLFRRMAVYAVMTAAVFIIATFITFFVLGFRFNVSDGRIEQYAFLQYASDPSGASVWVDGNYIGSNTPTKHSIKSGSHDFMMTKTGYKAWKKNVDVKAGIITWLNYILLVPDQLKAETVHRYDRLYDSLVSPDSKDIIVQYTADIPAFEIVDVSSDGAKSTKFTIPASYYSQAGVSGVKHVFSMASWDDGGRYLLLKHSYDSSEEWLVVDTQDANNTVNVTRLFNIKLKTIYFSGTSGNTLYALDSTDVRKLDLSAGTISRPLISSVLGFSLYDANVITYVGLDSKTSSQVVGVYREGDSEPHVIRTAGAKDVPLKIATTHYFNEDYIALSEGSDIVVMSGSYPNGSGSDNSNLKTISSFAAKGVVSDLSFSPSGQFLFVRSNSDFVSYDLEYRARSSFSIEGNSSNYDVKWLNDNYVWSNRDGSLTIREFDGANPEVISQVSSGQDALITSNGRYIYSFDKLGDGYQLQRVRMVLP